MDQVSISRLGLTLGIWSQPIGFCAAVLHFLTHEVVGKILCAQSRSKTLLTFNRNLDAIIAEDGLSFLPPGLLYDESGLSKVQEVA